MKLSHSKTIKAGQAQVWEAFHDWGGVWRFQPWVVRSPILSDVATGVGASRRCEFSDNTSIVETVTGLVDGKRVEFSLSETPKPMKSGFGSINLRPAGRNTEATVEMDVKLSMGPLNPLIGLMMKSVMRKRIDMMLRSLEHQLTTGKKLNPKGVEVSIPAAMPSAV